MEHAKHAHACIHNLPAHTCAHAQTHIRVMTAVAVRLLRRLIDVCISSVGFGSGASIAVDARPSASASVVRALAIKRMRRALVNYDIRGPICVRFGGVHCKTSARRRYMSDRFFCVRDAMRACGSLHHLCPVVVALSDIVE